MSRPEMTKDTSLGSKEQHEIPFISVVIPVWNGEGRIEHCLASLQKQTYPKERYEVIVADGESTDRTVQIAREYGAKVIKNRERNASAGRNIGIQEAQGDLLAFTEDDCILPSEWLATAERYLRDIRIGGVGGPTPLPDSASNFSKAVFTLFRWAGSVGYSIQSDIPIASDPHDLPGGNVVYRAAVIHKTGLFYNEKLITGEDVDLNIRIVKKGYRLAYRTDLWVWHNKRDKPLKFFHQIRRFAIGRIQLGRLHKGSVRLFHTVTAMAAPCGALLIFFMIINGYSWYAAKALMAGLFIILTAGYAFSKSFLVALLMIPVVGIFVTAWSCGYFSGLFNIYKI